MSAQKKFSTCGGSFLNIRPLAHPDPKEGQI